MIAVTGATGHFGRIVIAELLERGIEPSRIVAAVRDPGRAYDLSARGVVVRRADYDMPSTLVEALNGVERLLLISGTEVGTRLAQHTNVIEAARTTGVEFMAYTSIVRADTTPIKLAADHRETEARIRLSGTRYSFLRNSWYMEVYTGPLPQTLEHGAILGSAGDGRVSAAPRADYAAAAAAVLAGTGHDGSIYELGGDEAFSMPELAEEISRRSGVQVEYRNLPVKEYAKALAGFGLPEPLAAIYADADHAVSQGHLFVDSGDLRRLIGRPTTPLGVVLDEAIAAASSAD